MADLDVQTREWSECGASTDWLAERSATHLITRAEYRFLGSGDAVAKTKS